MHQAGGSALAAGATTAPTLYHQPIGWTQREKKETWASSLAFRAKIVRRPSFMRILTRTVCNNNNKRDKRANLTRPRQWPSSVNSRSVFAKRKQQQQRNESDFECIYSGLPGFTQMAAIQFHSLWNNSVGASISVTPRPQFQAIWADLIKDVSRQKGFIIGQLSRRTHTQPARQSSSSVRVKRITQKTPPTRPDVALSLPLISARPRRPERRRRRHNRRHQVPASPLPPPGQPCRPGPLLSRPPF